MARELRDAMRHALVVTHRKVGGKAGVNASAIRRADDDDRDMPTAENRQDALEVGGKAAVGDDDCRMVGARGERRSHLGLDAVVASTHSLVVANCLASLSVDRDLCRFHQCPSRQPSHHSHRCNCQSQA